MARSTKTRTVTMSDEAWAALRALADSDLRAINAELEFIILEVAKAKGIQVEADA